MPDAELGGSRLQPFRKARESSQVTAFGSIGLRPRADPAARWPGRQAHTHEAAVAQVGTRHPTAQAASQKGSGRPWTPSSTGGQMTARFSGREPFSSPDSNLPGRSQRPEAAQWQLVSEASHELRTPLTALRTEVELALMGDRDASELRAALRSAADEINRICRLADDILMLARADN